VETQVFLTHGVPEIVIADNGSQFISKEFNEQLAKYNVEKKGKTRFN
jgi:transposase InsO family protein